MFARVVLVRALGPGDPARALAELARQVGAPRSLADLGVAEPDLERVGAEVLANPYSNPRPVTAEALQGILAAAWKGELA